MYEYDEENIEKERKEKRNKKLKWIGILGYPILTYVFNGKFILFIFLFIMYFCYLFLIVKELYKNEKSYEKKKLEGWIENKEEKKIKKELWIVRIFNLIFLFIMLYIPLKDDIVINVISKFPNYVKNVEKIEKIIQNSEKIYIEGKELKNLDLLKKMIAEESKLKNILLSSQVIIVSDKDKEKWKPTKYLINEKNEKIGLVSKSCIVFDIEVEKQQIIRIDFFKKKNEKYLPVCKEIQKIE